MRMYHEKRSVSTIVKYHLEQDVINLREVGLSYQKIADELNASGKVPEDDPINWEMVQRFVNHLPKLKKEVVRRDHKRMVAVVDNSIDIISEMTGLYGKAKTILDALEERATSENKSIDPYRFKAMSSEMREMLKQMTDMQKDLHDYNNTKIFMQTVMDVLQDVSPESIPIIIDRLKMNKGSNIFN